MELRRLADRLRRPAGQGDEAAGQHQQVPGGGGCSLLVLILILIVILLLIILSYFLSSFPFSWSSFVSQMMRLTISMFRCWADVEASEGPAGEGGGAEPLEGELMDGDSKD